MSSRRSFLTRVAAGLVAGYKLVGVAFAQSTPELKNLGLVGIKSSHDRYLQAHADNGETHASNKHRNEEETWFLWQVDKSKHIYALQNWSNGKFLSGDSTCARANKMELGKSEQWIFKKSDQYLNLVCMRNVAANHLLGANAPGDDTECGGEVACKGGGSEPRNEPNWAGWWRFEDADKPSPGKNVWNTVGGFFQDVAVNVAKAGVAKLLQSL